MRKNRKGSAATSKKQQTFEEGLECYSVKSMPQNVKERSNGLVNCEKDITKAVTTLMEGETVGKATWCKNRMDTLSGVAFVVESEIFVNYDKMKLMEKLLGGEVALRAIGNDLWLVTVFWLD